MPRSPSPGSPEQKISEDDFFRLNAEFRHWLKRKKDYRFDDLDTQKQRHYFRKFVKKWNRGELSDSYYNGKYSRGSEAASRSDHNWKFASSITGDERRQLDAVKEANDDDIGPDLPEPEPKRRSRQGPQAPHPADLAEYKRSFDRSERKKLRQRYKEDMEELVPKETGREARIAKKRAARDARRQRDVSPETDEKTLMGSGGDFQSVLRYKRAKRDQRMHEKRAQANEKIDAFKAKEAAKMAELRAMAAAARGSNSLWKS